MDLQSATAAELYRFLEASWRGTTWVGRATFQTAQRLHALMMDSNRPSGIPADWESEGGSATSRGIPARRALLLPLRASLQEARRIGRLALDGAHKIRVALVRDPPPIDDGWEMINDSSSSEDGTAEINNHGWDDNGGLFDDEPLSSGYVLADTISNHNSSSEDDEQPPSRRVSAPLDLPADLSLSRDPPTNPWTSSQPIHQDSELREHVEQNRTPRTTMKGTPQPPTPPRRPAEQRKQPSAPMAASDNPRTPHPATGPHQKERREAQSTDGATQPAQQPDGRLTSDEVLERLRGRLATRGPRPGASRARSRPAWVPCDGHELVDAGLRARIGEAKRRARGGGEGGAVAGEAGVDGAGTVGKEAGEAAEQHWKGRGTGVGREIGGGCGEGSNTIVENRVPGVGAGSGSGGEGDRAGVDSDPVVGGDRDRTSSR